MTQNLSVPPATVPGGVPSPSTPAGPPTSGSGSGHGSGGRRNPSVVLIVVGAAVAVVAAIAGFVLLNRGGGPDADTTPITHSARSTRGTSPSATASGAVTPALTSGRNPFLLPAGASSVTGTGVPSGTGSTSTTPSGTATTTPASTTTVTQTVTATPLYVGLYGFSGSKAVFWVNDTKYTVAVGGTFGGFTYTSKTTAGCAKVRRSGTTTTICPGIVKQFG